MTILQSEHLADLADTAADLGAGIRTLTETSITLYFGADTVVTVESHFLSGRMLRSVLRPRVDPGEAASA